MRFELDGSVADGELVCRGTDDEGRELEYRARTAAPGPDVKPLGDLAAEVLRRGVPFQEDDRPLSFEYATVTEREVPIMYCHPRDAANAPVVFFNHGTGGDAVSQLFMGIPLARAGFFTVLLDAHLHGRRRPGDWQRRFFGLNYKENYVTMLVDTCDDISRLIDHLADDPRADAARVGISGISQGGFVSFMAITRDERISVAAPIVGSPDLEGQYGNSEPLEDHAQEVQDLVVRVSPLRQAEKMYPTKLFVQNGDEDELVPVAGTRKLDAILGPLYADRPADYVYREYPGQGHQDEGMRQPAIDWLVRHLVEPK